MELLVIILNRTELLNDLLSVLVETGVDKATIFESEGMGHHLAYNVPIFAGIRQLVGESAGEGRTIMAITEDSGIMEELPVLLKDAGIDFEKKGTGVIFTVPVSGIIKYQ